MEMKLFLKRSLALFVSIVLLFGVLPEVGVTKPIVGEAQAAGTPFTEEEFRKCYAKVLLSQVGKRYDAGGGASGYTVNGTLLWQSTDRVTSGTPYSPANLNGNATYDCYGLVLTALMSMGYDYFEDASGKKYYLNAWYGGTIFSRVGANSSQPSLLYDHGTGDIITLHHCSDKQYNVKFKIGEIRDKSTLASDEVMGTFLLSLSDVPQNTKKTPGPFTAGQIYDVNHVAVALFKLNRDINDTMPQNAAYAQANVTAASIGYSSASPARR